MLDNDLWRIAFDIDPVGMDAMTQSAQCPRVNNCLQLAGPILLLSTDRRFALCGQHFLARHDGRGGRNTDR